MAEYFARGYAILKLPENTSSSTIKQSNSGKSTAEVCVKKTEHTQRKKKCRNPPLSC